LIWGLEKDIYVFHMFFWLLLFSTSLLPSLPVSFFSPQLIASSYLVLPCCILSCFYGSQFIWITKHNTHRCKALDIRPFAYSKHVSWSIFQPEQSANGPHAWCIHNFRYESNGKNIDNYMCLETLFSFLPRTHCSLHWSFDLVMHWINNWWPVVMLSIYRHNLQLNAKDTRSVKWRTRFGHWRWTI
jgi:hypothetical protein